MPEEDGVPEEDEVVARARADGARVRALAEAMDLRAGGAGAGAFVVLDPFTGLPVPNNIAGGPAGGIVPTQIDFAPEPPNAN